MKRSKSNAFTRAAARPDDPRALKILLDFRYHKKFMAIQGREEEAPVVYDETPNQMLSPEDLTSMCYSRAQTPDEILMLKEDETLDPDRAWDSKYSQYRMAARELLTT